MGSQTFWFEVHRNLPEMGQISPILRVSGPGRHLRSRFCPAVFFSRARNPAGWHLRGYRCCFEFQRIPTNRIVIQITPLMMLFPAIKYSELNNLAIKKKQHDPARCQETRIVPVAAMTFQPGCPLQTLMTCTANEADQSHCSQLSDHRGWVAWVGAVDLTRKPPCDDLLRLRCQWARSCRRGSEAGQQREFCRHHPREFPPTPVPVPMFQSTTSWSRSATVLGVYWWE